jgi:cell division protein FtsW
MNGRRHPSYLNRVAQRRHRPDYWLLLLSTALLALGLIVVYTIGPGLAAQHNVGDNYYINRQLVAVLLGIGTFALCAYLPLQIWPKLEKPLLVASATAALAVRVFGEQINGAYRWIHIGGLSFQAVELIKFSFIIWLAGFLVARLREGCLDSWAKTFKPLLTALGIIGFVVAIMQRDLGSTGVIVAMMAAMCYVVGLPLKRVAQIGVVIVLATSLVLAVGPSYRRERLFTFLHPEQDCLNTGYQACEALISVGSGGLAGRGLAKSVQAYGYQPEAANDSIFAIYAEKFGFIGTVALLGLFVALFGRLRRIIERAPDDYSRLIATGVLAWLSTQAIINIGAMLGLLPLKGITLPFISYGGTSLIFITGAVGLVFQISRYTSLEAPRARQDKNYGTRNYTIGYANRRP